MGVIGVICCSQLLVGRFRSMFFSSAFHLDGCEQMCYSGVVRHALTPSERAIVRWSPPPSG
jgi:hypothetical protein